MDNFPGAQMSTDDKYSRTKNLTAGADLGTLVLPPSSLLEVQAARQAPAGMNLRTARATPPPQTCQQTLTLTFFFDGTGNNMSADVGTFEHSNVARLFRSHWADDGSMGRYRFYIPGIGTLFKDREVNDPGGTFFGGPFGAQGQDRLNWAFSRMREKVKAAEQRAQNPTNKICWIKIGVFGFSRGAALARAFCRDLQKMCREDGSVPEGWRLATGNHPIEITFLGIFDTVASCGLPPSVNNAQRNTYVRAVAETHAMARVAKSFMTPELKKLAFGTPGADPTRGPVDGHADWAKGMHIGAMVKRCLHLLSAHEQRNSFGLDSALHQHPETGRFYLPSGTTEALCPGVHSDVGGGYRPGEGGCRPERGAQLNLIALRAMHAEAIKFVPLVPLHALQPAEREDFALDPEGSKHYAHMLTLYNRYMDVASGAQVPGATSGLGGQINRHMRVYFAWRFRAIRAGKQPTQTAQRQQVERGEQQFAQDRKKLAAEQTAAAADLRKAQDQHEYQRGRLQNAYQARHQFGTPVAPELLKVHDIYRQSTAEKQKAYDQVSARVAAAADDSELNAAIAKYDALLLADARQIVAWVEVDKTLKLRPHYAALVEAYLDEYVRGQGLRDPQVIEFFDEYVHDSLAAFNLDETWPSDPRVVYVGSDNKLRYAGLVPNSMAA